jgi:hypothetical protein
MNKTGKVTFASFLSKTDRLISPGAITKAIEAVVQRLSLVSSSEFFSTQRRSFLPNGFFSTWGPAGRSQGEGKWWAAIKCHRQALPFLRPSFWSVCEAGDFVRVCARMNAAVGRAL